MFNKKNLPTYIAALGVIFVVGTLAKNATTPLEKDDDMELIKNYLLNESPLYGYNRPKLWIHSKYEKNSRKWINFLSRNTYDLNQDYLHLTIKTIINHCGDDFNICLIDDDSFGKLLPNWDVDLTNMAEPMKSNFRLLGMCQLIYVYGGMAIPNSMVCLKNLKNTFDDLTANNSAFVCESLNKTCNLKESSENKHFVPSIEIIGACNKNNESIGHIVEYLKQVNLENHFHNEVRFLGFVNYYCNELIKDQKLNLLGGEYIGIKNNQKKPILLEDLCEEAYLDLHPNVVGIHIPSEELLRRTKYNWIAVMKSDDLLNTNMIISKYLKASIQDTTNEYFTSNQKTVVSI